MAARAATATKPAPTAHAYGPPDLIPLAEAARRLNVSRDTLRDLIAHGELAAYRLGKLGHIKVRDEDLRNLYRPVGPQ